MAPSLDPQEAGFRWAGAADVDDRGRLALGKALRGLRELLGGGSVAFHVWLNQSGQVLLDPVVTVPLRERWRPPPVGASPTDAPRRRPPSTRPRRPGQK